MALDIHIYENGKMGRLLFQIDDKLYNQLSPCFDLFEGKTGEFIDPYGDLIVDEHLDTLIDCLSVLETSTSLVSILEEVQRDRAVIIFVGD